MSPDPVATHRRFKTKHDLTFPLVADTDHAICERYGVWAEKSLYGRKYWGVARTTYLIDAAGHVARVFEKVEPDGHAAKVADAVDTLARR